MIERLASGILNPTSLFLIVAILWGIMYKSSIFQNLEASVELFSTLTVLIVGTIVFIKTAEWKEISMHSYSIFYIIGMSLYTIMGVSFIFLDAEYYPFWIILSLFNVGFILCSTISHTPQKQPIVLKH